MMVEANPYSSPQTEAKSAEPTGERLPLGKLLLGLALVPVATALAFALLWPIHASIKYAAGAFLVGRGGVIFGTTLEMFTLMLSNAFYFGGLNALLFGLPAILPTWRRRRLQPRGVLLGGMFIAGGWMLLMLGSLVMTAIAQPGSGDSLFDGPHGTLNVCLIGLEYAFFGPLPLLVAVVVYAWWVRRLTQAVSMGRSGDA